MSLQLDTPDAFPAFPYDPPYSIQVDLMRHLYTSIEQRAVTIVESPTGTGKTLSLLCAALTWLSGEKERARRGKLKAAADDGTGAKDWVIEQTMERMRRDLEDDERDYEERLAEARRKEEAMRRMAKARVVKKAKHAHNSKPDEGPEDDDQFLPETDQAQTSIDGEINVSAALRALMDKVDRVRRPGHLNDDEEATCTKIYYASRTHSQLAQVLPELSRLKLRHSLSSVQNHHSESSQCHVPQKRPSGDEEHVQDPTPPSTRTVSLGSRKQLCINDELRAKSRDLDESCRELLGEKAEKRCQYLPRIEEDVKMLDFRDQILAYPKDIEDLATAGRHAHICPYFGSRRAIPQAELVTLPYNLLLQKSAREALGIDLKDQIVIIDEAHNLIPTLLSLSTTRLPYSIIATSLIQVCSYVSRFRTRLSAVNMLHLKRLVVFLDALKKYVLEWKDAREGKGPSEKTEVMKVAELMEKMGKKVAGMNLLEIEGYLKRSKVARKIAGYSDKQAEKEADSTRKRNNKGTIPPLHAVEDFMVSLTRTNDDGRVTFTLTPGLNGENTVELQYQLLNPSPTFIEVVDEARAVILAGGTMSPISDVVNQLFSHLPPTRVTSFSCGHIIPAINLQALVVCKGPRGGDLEFKAAQQGDPAVISELGQILFNFASLVPAGMIVFFPSYHFLNVAKAAWTKSGMLEKFGLKKTTFFEPEESVDVEKVLQEYAKSITISSPTGKKGGALLFAVIGAKLSEGLNFADDLARAVVIVGLPFANLASPELRERMKYVKRLEEKRGVTKKERGLKDAAAELYENMCMNAVNQSIGRAVRHKGDWASLLLLDRRYATTSIRNKLPKWIGSGLIVRDGFGPTVKEMGSFYKGKRDPNMQ